MQVDVALLCLGRCPGDLGADLISQPLNILVVKLDLAFRSDQVLQSDDFLLLQHLSLLYFEFLVIRLCQEAHQKGVSAQDS